MFTQSSPNFPHRHNINGYYDSICTTCHLTIASARSEAQLDDYERKHTCNPIRLYQDVYKRQLRSHRLLRLPAHSRNRHPHGPRRTAQHPHLSLIHI